MSSVKFKYCDICGKILFNFFKHKRFCKECVEKRSKEYQRSYYLDNKVKLLEYQKARRKKLIGVILDGV